MEDVTQQVLGVAKGISEVGLLIITTAFYLVVTAILVIFVFSMFKRMISDTVSKQHTALDAILKNQIEQKQETKQIKERLTSEQINHVSVLIKLGFYHDLHELLLSVAQIKEENNLDNKEYIDNKLNRVINNLYENRKHDFDFFTYHGKKLSEFMNLEWKKKVFEFCLEAVYDGQQYDRKLYLTNFSHLFDEMEREYFKTLKKK
jgi:hypothetical protein